MLIRDIAAFLLLLILYWAFSSGDIMRAILVLVAIFILYALMDPLDDALFSRF